MAYVFSTNNTPPTSVEAVWQLKSALLAAGWTVVSSGTGSGGTFALGDLITSAAVLSNPSVWFVVQSPAGAGSASFGFVRANAVGSQFENWAIAFDPLSSWAAPSSPSALPMGANSVWILHDPAFGVQRWLPPTPGTYAWNVCADNAAPYPFWAGGIALGGGSAPSGIMFEAVTGAPAGDARPYVISAYVQQFGDGVFAVNTFGPYAQQTWGAYDPGLASTTLEPCSSFYLQNTSGQTVYQGSVQNPITGKDELYPLLYTRIAGAGGTWQGLKGLGVMAVAGGTARAVGDTYSVTTARDRIRLGNNLALPWDGSVPVF